jgi:hypothetical protein
VTGIIPFLVNYFGKYYNRKDATMYGSPTHATPHTTTSVSG